MFKNLIWGPSYGGLKTSCCEIVHQMMDALLKQPPQVHFWRNQEMLVPIRERIAWGLFWGLTILKDVIFSLSYKRSKLVSIRDTSCFVFLQLITFSGFHFFHFISFQIKKSNGEAERPAIQKSDLLVLNKNN